MATDKFCLPQDSIWRDTQPGDRGADLILTVKSLAVRIWKGRPLQFSNKSRNKDQSSVQSRHSKYFKHPQPHKRGAGLDDPMVKINIITGVPK